MAFHPFSNKLGRSFLWSSHSASLLSMKVGLRLFLLPLGSKKEDKELNTSKIKVLFVLFVTN